MKFVHGTSSAHLESINEHGLLPPEGTGNSSEKRTERLNGVHLLDAEHTRLAAAYAIRATQHWGGDPIVISGEVPEAALTKAIDGKGRFPDIFTAPYIPPVHIEGVTQVDERESMSDLFKLHKS